MNMAPYHKMNAAHIKSLKSATKEHGGKVTRLALEHLKSQAEKHAHKVIDDVADIAEKKVAQKIDATKLPSKLKKVAKTGVSIIKKGASVLIKNGVSKKIKM